MKLRQKKLAWHVADVCRRIGMAWRVQHGLPLNVRGRA